jgi:4-amino-4-deoxychorismate lyase
MCRLIETIRIINGKAQNLFWHNKRFNASRNELLGIHLQIDLGTIISIPAEYRTGEVKCRIIYGKEIELIEFESYTYKDVKSLKLVSNDLIEYGYKYQDRSTISELFSQKGEKDDIIIIKKGLVTDSSYGNLIFSDGKVLITPSSPLLKGTKRSRYLAENKIIEKDIAVNEIWKFSDIHLINAFLDLGRCVVQTTNVS